MVKNITDDIWQVFGRHHFFLVAQLDDTLGNLTHRVVVDIDTQRLQVHADIRFTGRLAERILADASETFGNQVVAIQIVLAVAIGVHPGTLRKDMFADDRTVRGDMDA